MDLAGLIYGSVPPLAGVDALHALPNIFGGMDALSDGGASIFHTMPNIFGGQDVFGAHGEVLGHSATNIFGGHDFVGSHGEVLGHSVTNIFGGHDFVGAHGDALGHSATNIFGGHDFVGAHEGFAGVEGLTDAHALFHGGLPDIGFDAVDVAGFHDAFDFGAFDVPDVDLGGVDFDF